MVLPVVVWNFPGTHLRHTVTPSKSEYMPGQQTKHRLLESAATVVEYVPLEQLVQVDAAL